MDELIGQTLGKYKIGSLLGKGAMGRVYEAEHVFIRKRCALKILNPEIAGDAGFKMRALRESQAAATINHPNIVDVSDFGEDQHGAPYIVMEFLDGEPLGDLIDREAPLKVDLCLHIAIEILRGLDAAHNAGIIHRDIKPDNVFLCPDGDRPYPRIKIVDFGISKVTTVEGEMALTQTGSVMGTPLYMSIEQAEGSKEVDHRTDIYSVGIMLYEMLSGHLPFVGDTFASIILRVMENRPTDLSTLTSRLPIGLKECVMCGMAVAVARRYQTAREFCVDLTEVQRSLTGSNHQSFAPTSAVEMQRSSPLSEEEDFLVPGAGAKRWLAIAIALVVLAIVGIAVVSAFGPSSPQVENSQSSDEAPAAGSPEQRIASGDAAMTFNTHKDAGSAIIAMGSSTTMGAVSTTTSMAGPVRPVVRGMQRLRPQMRPNPPRRRSRRADILKRLRKDVPF